MEEQDSTKLNTSRDYACEVSSTTFKLVKTLERFASRTLRVYASNLSVLVKVDVCFASNVYLAFTKEYFPTIAPLRAAQPMEFAESTRNPIPRIQMDVPHFCGSATNKGRLRTALPSVALSAGVSRVTRFAGEF